MTFTVAHFADGLGNLLPCNNVSFWSKADYPVYNTNNTAKFARRAPFQIEITKCPVNQDLRGIIIWRLKPESDQRGRTWVSLLLPFKSIALVLIWARTHLRLMRPHFNHITGHLEVLNRLMPLIPPTRYKQSVSILFWFYSRRGRLSFSPGTFNCLAFYTLRSHER